MPIYNSIYTGAEVDAAITWVQGRNGANGNFLFDGATAANAMTKGIGFATGVAETGTVPAGEGRLWFNGTALVIRVGTTNTVLGAGGDVFDANGNLLIGSESTIVAPTSLADGIAWMVGVAPTVDVANQISLWVGDRTAGEAGLRIRSESGVLSHIGDRVGFGTLTPLGRIHAERSGLCDLILGDLSATANQRLWAIRKTGSRTQFGPLNDAASTFTRSWEMDSGGLVALTNDSLQAGVGFGADCQLSLSRTVTAGVGVDRVVRARLYRDQAADTSSSGVAFDSYLWIASGNTRNYTSATGQIGFLGVFYHEGTGTITTGIGNRGDATAASTGNITTAIGLQATVRANNASAVIATGIGLNIPAFTATGTITTRWAILQEGASEHNSFAGNILLGGTSVPTSLAKGLAITNGTAPTASLTDGVILWAGDRAAGESGLRIRSENGTLTHIGDRVGFGTLTPLGMIHSEVAGNNDLIIANSSMTANQRLRTLRATSDELQIGLLNDAGTVFSPHLRIGGDAQMTIGNANIDPSSTSGAALWLQHTTTASSGTVYGAVFSPVVASPVNSSGLYDGIVLGNQIGAGGQIYSGRLVGVRSNVYYSGTGSLAEMRGMTFDVRKLQSGNVTEMKGMHIVLQNANASGTVTNAYGVHIGPTVRTGTVTNSFAIYQEGASDHNFFAGNVLLGTATLPSSLANGLVLVTGTAATGTVTAGHIAIWFDGTDLRARIGITDYTFTKT